MASLANTGVKSNSASRSALARESFYVRVGKRWFDASVSLAGLVLLSPVILVVGIAVKLTSSGPAFYRQFRVGQFGRSFRIVKFRSMVENADRAGPSITAYGDSRITGLGRWMRKNKIDEIPQLFNVFVGDMSLVGPRPEVPVYTAAYTQSQCRVFRQKPGITGPAASAYVCEEEILAGQKEARRFYAAEIVPKKLELDLRYCEDIRFASDIKMIFETFAIVIERSVKPQISLQHKPGSPNPARMEWTPRNISERRL
jgi:lipopolysaccharide/colanic/teichoic acid biosynthesis glycosyltransferase